MTPLERHIGKHTSSRYERGYNDCFTFAARWLACNGHTDPRALVDMRYTGKYGAIRNLRRAGFPSLHSLLSSCAPATTTPRPGDILLLTGGTPLGVACIMWDMNFMATIDEAQGAILRPLRFNAAWSVNYGR